MNFNFTNPGQPAATTPETAPTTQPAAGGFGGPPPQAAAPIDAATALDGFGGAGIDVRDPFLPLGFAGKVRLDSTEAKTGRDVGFAIYIRMTVTEIGAIRYDDFTVDL